MQPPATESQTEQKWYNSFTGMLVAILFLPVLLLAAFSPCATAQTAPELQHPQDPRHYDATRTGAVVDLAECEEAVRHAVALAERMAKVHVESVLLSVSAGRLQGQLVEAAADIKGCAVTDVWSGLKLVVRKALR